MLFDRHGAGPDPEAFADAQLDMPNGSARMDNLSAAVLLPQLEKLSDTLTRWDRRGEIVRKRLASVPGVVLPTPSPEAHRIGSSIQWRIPGLDAEGCRGFVASCACLGVEVKWFGEATPRGFTSAHQSWRYVAAQTLPQTDRVLATLFDMRLPLTFSEDDCRVIADIIAAVVHDMKVAA